MPSLATVARLSLQLGASFALYAGALVLATALQSAHDAAVTAERRPLQKSAEWLRTERAYTERQLAAAVRALSAAGDRYDRLDGASAGLAAALDRLASNVKHATGSAARLPASVPMPAAPSTVYVNVPAPAPSTHTTSGASGR
jgi:hypothetical protein